MLHLSVPDFVVKSIKGWLLAFFFLSLSACADKEPEPVSPDNWQKVTEQGLFEVTLDPAVDGPVAINEFLEWVLTVKTPDGEPVDPARISVNGGMRAHGHGLPSQPQVGEHPEAGKYLLKGLQFSMNGLWQLAFDIQSKEQSDKVTFELKIDY